ncbi:hypothetical protein OMW55_01610 [Sphingomonas sp. BN140010]|uniref:Uncharacterized protein n=1 Tax=Sphingomonas arvum TaxID=2992113 RepID=A0ABT3JBR5_9SPHN|nr:hypothetical protein [Sphingomonas sp. BN140010]MCW3796507.1 hypothetical protein [Sphingomonas sp. BN140010]
MTDTSEASDDKAHLALQLLQQALCIVDDYLADGVLGAKLSDCVERLQQSMEASRPFSSSLSSGHTRND